MILPTVEENHHHVQIWLYTQVSTLPVTLIATTKLHWQNLIQEFIIANRANASYGNTKRLVTFLLDEKFMNLIGKELCQI